MERTIEVVKRKNERRCREHEGIISIKNIPGNSRRIFFDNGSNYKIKNSVYKIYNVYINSRKEKIRTEM